MCPKYSNTHRVVRNVLWCPITTCVASLYFYSYWCFHFKRACQNLEGRTLSFPMLKKLKGETHQISIPVVWFPSPSICIMTHHQRFSIARSYSHHPGCSLQSCAVGRIVPETVIALTVVVLLSFRPLTCPHVPGDRRTRPHPQPRTSHWFRQNCPSAQTRASSVDSKWCVLVFLWPPMHFDVLHRHPHVFSHLYRGNSLKKSANIEDEHVQQSANNLCSTVDPLSWVAVHAINKAVQVTRGTQDDVKEEIFIGGNFRFFFSFKTFRMKFIYGVNAKSAF